jgi:apolipoprotein N-acyltransferase
VLLALSFPTVGHPVAAWIALAPLLTALTSGSLARAFTLGLITGLIYFTGTLYWITRVMSVYGGLHPVVAVLVNAALIVYLSLFPAVFALVTRRLASAYGTRGLLASPLVWVATELGRTYLLTGFPWVLLGYSQASVLPVAQTASLAGVYGLSALVCAVSAGVAIALTPGSRPRPVFTRMLPLAVSSALVAALAVWGGLRISRGTLLTGPPVRVGLIQGNVEQSQKWDPARAPAIFQDYLRMTRQAIAGGAGLVIWPESSTPFTFGMDHASTDAIRTIARESRVPILLGSEEIERGVPTKYYNSAYLVQSDGATAGVYRKMHLVPFGEYVPLKRVLFFAAPLVEAVSDFSAGDSAVLLPVDGRRISVAICYEIVYPDLVRRFVAEGSELLTTITNDAWFGETAAPHQHFAQASLRAIENGRFLVRAANTGVSGVVDPYGRVAARSDLFEPAVIVTPVVFQTATTVYTRIGDLFAYLATVLVAALLLVGVKSKSSNP